jgi:hypothetical protein
LAAADAIRDGRLKPDRGSAVIKKPRRSGALSWARAVCDYHHARRIMTRRAKSDALASSLD